MQPDLVAFLENAGSDMFPTGANYYTRYVGLDNYMNENVHPDVVLGCISNDGGLLNDHGPNHIRTVISRASAMLFREDKADPEFTPYEIYLLLCAIHFHDVGNVYGRKGHENRHQNVMRELKPLLGNDAPEMKCILKMAHAHGGQMNGDKDKIGKLEEAPVNGCDVRSRAIAAVLRFADELADDRHRSNRFLLDHDRLPKEAEVYHKYAACLDFVMVRPDEGCVDLHFCLSTDDAKRLWGKGMGENHVEEVYLVDEIYARTLKMHLERSYCSRFMRPYVVIDRINVTIEIFDELASIDPPREKIQFRLEESGYPEEPKGGIEAICGSLKSGEQLAQTFSAGEG